MNETTALIVARKIELGRRLDCNEPEATAAGAEMTIYFEGRKIRVTVQDLGPEG